MNVANLKKRLMLVPAAAGALVLTSVANATVDTSAIDDALVDIAAVGTAVFAVYVAIKLVKWIRRSL